MKISANKFVSCTYKLYVPNDGNQELMEEATTEAPLEYVHGMGMMLQAFEENLFGLEAGDKFDFELSVEEAYGEPQKEAVVELPREIFLDEEGNFDEKIIREGEVLPMRDAEGNTLRGLVVEVRDDVVVLDFNHPLAGERLHFVGEVIDVHEATAEELQQIFGASGCSSCGSGCGSGEDDGCGCGSSCGGGSCC